MVHLLDNKFSFNMLNKYNFDLAFIKGARAGVVIGHD